MKFIKQSVKLEDFECDESCLHAFASIDDYDIWGAIKVWINHPDKVLSTISRMLLDRKIFKVILSAEKPDKQLVRNIRKQVMKQYDVDSEAAAYLLIEGSTSNAAYLAGGETINILTKKERL